MWKIKDNVDLDILIDYGFKFYGDVYKKKVYIKSSNGGKVCYIVTLNREFIITNLENQLDDTIYVLIKNNILEYNYIKGDDIYVQTQK